MDYFPTIDQNFQYTPHIVILVIIFISQSFSKTQDAIQDLNPEQKKKGDRIIGIYLVIFQISKAADWSLGPVRFEYLEQYHGLNDEQIAQYLALSFVSSLFFGTFFLGYLNDKANRKFPCILYGVLLISSNLVIIIRSSIAVFVSQMIFGMSCSVLYSSFENWFVSECNKTLSDKAVKDAAFSEAFEKSAIFDSMCAVSVSVMTGVVKRSYGIQAPYVFSTCLSLVSIAACSKYLTSLEIEEGESKHESEDSQIFSAVQNLGKCMSECRKNPFIVLIGLTESLIFACLHIFIFAWTPTLKTLKPDLETSEIFTLFMMAYMAGGSSFRAIYIFLNKDSLKVAKIVSFLCLLSFICTNLYISYQVTLFGFLFLEASAGMFYPTYSKIKSEYLPSHISGSLLNLFKVPFNVIVTFLLVTMNKIFTMNQLLVLSLCFSGFVFIVHLIAFNKSKEEDINEKEKQLKMVK